MAAPSARLNWNRAASSADPAPGVEAALLEGLHASDGKRGPAATDRRIQSIRQLACELFDWPFPEGVVFTPGATFALNQAVACIPTGSPVWCSALEHNSSLRPLHRRKLRGEIDWTIGGFGDDGRVQVAELQGWLASQSNGSAWVFLSLGSNALGTIQPVEQVAALCQQYGAKLVLDLAQGAGHIPLSLQQLAPWCAALPAHKGLHGPPGVGLMFVHPSESAPGILAGGTGLSGESLEMPTQLPLRFEAGTPNLPGIFGLGAALQWRLDTPAQLDGVRAQLAQLEHELQSMEHWQILPQNAGSWDSRLPVLSLVHSEVPPAVLCSLLDQAGIEARAGMLCAALAAPHASDNAQQGVLRLSPPLDASADDFQRVKAALTSAVELFAGKKLA